MFVNVELERIDHEMGIVASLGWQYNLPLNVPQNWSAVCPRTSQNETSVSVQNLSATFDLTFYVLGGGLSETVTIKANDRTPWRKVHNFDGTKLRIANISQEAATLKATLIDLGD